MAIYEMHQCRVAHGDLTGRNVIIQYNPSTQDFNIVLLDFGFCKTLDPPSDPKISYMIDLDG